jgi:hypothetical protein
MYTGGVDPRIPVVKMGSGYLRAILLNGREAVYGRDLPELIGRLKFRIGAGSLRIPPTCVADLLDFRGRMP